MASIEPSWLEKTVSMLRCAFSDGHPDAMYRPLLLSLYEHMSDRNLAEAVSSAFDMEYERVLNDIYDVARKRDVSDDDHRILMNKLSEAGFDAWLADES